MSFKIEHINPEGGIKNPAFTNVIVVSGSYKTIYIGEQNANNGDGQIIGKGNIKEQTAQVLKNIKACLAAADAQPKDIIKWTMFIVQGQSLQEGFEAFQQNWERNDKPPVITGVFVSALANPDYLIGIEAIAVVPDK